MTAGARLPTSVSVLKSPCAVPCAAGGAARWSAAIVGPNQHSAKRYSPKRKASESSSDGAVSVAAQKGIARSEPAAGTSCAYFGWLVLRRSTTAPPRVAEAAPAMPLTPALSSANSSPIEPGKAPR